MPSLLRTDKALYTAVVVEALTVLLTAFSVLPAQALLFLTAAMVIYMATLKPLVALRFFILSIPWFVAVPIISPHLQNWRILAIELLLLVLWHHRKEIFVNPPKFLKNLGGRIDYAFFAFFAAGLISLFNATFIEVGLRYIVWLINVYLIFLVARLVLTEDGAKQKVAKSVVISTLTLVIAGFVQLFLFLRLPIQSFWNFSSNNIISTLYGTDLG